MGCAMTLIVNLLIMCAVLAIILVGTLFWLDRWTLHGHYQTVPDVKGRPYDSANKILSLEGFVVDLSDSIYDRNTLPGTVIEQNPKEGTKVKPGRTVYLVINAFSPKSVTVPALTDISVRQAKSSLEGLGISSIRIVSVPSEYRDLVLSAKLDGRELQPGARIPVTSTVVLEVGDGLPELNEGDSGLPDDSSISSDDDLDLL